MKTARERVEERWNVYLVEELDTGVHYHVVASSEGDAIETACNDGDLEGDVSARLRDPTKTFSITFVDGCDYDGEAEQWAKDGFIVAGDPEAPVVSGTFAQWANHYRTPMVISCNEW